MKTILQLVGLAIIGVLAISSEKITSWGSENPEAEETPRRYKISDRSKKAAFSDYAHLTQKEAFNKIETLPWSTFSGFSPTHQNGHQAIAFLHHLGRSKGRSGIDEVHQYFRSNEMKAAVVMTYVFAGWAEKEPNLALAAYHEFTTPITASTPINWDNPISAKVFSWKGDPMVALFG